MTVAGEGLRRSERGGRGPVWHGHLRPVLQVADQGTSALVNFGVNTAVARVAGVVGLGEFNLPYTIYLAAVALQRAVLVEPLLASADADRVYPGTVRLSLAASGIAAALLVGVGLLLGLREMAVLGVVLPFLLLQDLVRYRHLRAERPERALVMDIIWLIAVLSPLVLPVRSAIGVEIAWGTGAAVGIAIGLLLGARPTLARTDVAEFRQAARGISGATAGDMLIVQFLWYLPLAIALQALSVQVSGEYRIATTLMAPLGVIASSWTLSTYARVRKSPDVRRMPILRSSFAILAVSLVYAGVMNLIHPVVGRLVFGSGTDVPLLVMLLVSIIIPVQSFEGQLGVWFKFNRAAINITVARAFATVAIVAFIALTVALGLPIWLTGAVATASLIHTIVSVGIYRRVRTRLIGA